MKNDEKRLPRLSDSLDQVLQSDPHHPRAAEMRAAINLIDRAAPEKFKAEQTKRNDK